MMATEIPRPCSPKLAPLNGFEASPNTATVSDHKEMTSYIVFYHGGKRISRNKFPRHNFDVAFSVPFETC